MAAPEESPASLAVERFSDWRWRLNNLYEIVDSHGSRIPFRMNWAQQRLFEGMHYLNVVLKARQLGFCLDPSTRVLTADLRWVPIGELAPGQEIVSVDEYPPGGRGQARRMRTATVTAAGSVHRKAYRITFDDGREVICTGQHPWLSKKVGSRTDWRKIENGNKKKLTVGTRVRWITKPWGLADVEDGWFGGMLDGEGSISKACTRASINVSQRQGPVWDRLVAYVESRGYHHCIEGDEKPRESKFGRVPVPKVVVGRMDEMFRLVGQTRPTRFIQNRFWDGRELPGKRSGGVGWAKITSIEPLDERPMVDLQTSTGTYVAEGFVSHNTTFIQIFMLDACVFNSNVSAGTIAHTLNDATEIFQNKIKVGYDSLPEGIRNVNPAVQDAAQKLSFKNGSSIRVGMSLRSGTFQYLHVSEYGKLCARYPDRAKEVRTGALNTVQAGEVIFIESTAEGREGDFYDICKRAQNLRDQGGKLTPLDFKFHFFPWWEHPAYRLDPEGVPIPADMETYFGKLDGMGITLSPGQRAWYVKKAETQGDDMKREYPSTAEEAFEASVEGAYFQREMTLARKQGRIGKVPLDPGLPVNTFWDLGRNDATAIWFHQRRGFQNCFVGYYENSGEWIGHYAQVLNNLAKENGFVYGRHFGPHDIEVAEIGAPNSRLRTAAEMGLTFDVVHRVKDKGDGIEAARRVLASCWFDEEACAEGIKHLDSYRKEWDDKNGVWKDKPKHDQASHGADAFQTFALSGVDQDDEEAYEDSGADGRSPTGGY